MDLQTIISSGLEDQLKCSCCQNYLSYSPILVCSNNQRICGRCKAPEGVTSFKDGAFEVLSQFFRFPCRYKSEGCLEEFLPEDVPNHEEICRYRIVACIVDNPKQCSWKGSLPLLTLHCREEHSSIILKKGKFKLNVSDSSVSQHLLEKEDYFLIFKTKFSSKTLQCALFHDQYRTGCETSTYKLKIRSGNTSSCVNLTATSFWNPKIETVSLNLIIDDSALSAQIFDSTVGETRCETCSKLTSETGTCILNTGPMCSTCLSSHKRDCVFCTGPKLKKTERCRSYCPVKTFFSCGWKGTKRDVTTHLITAHEDIIETSPVDIVANSNYIFMVFVKVCDSLFRVVYCRHFSNVFKGFVQAVGDDHDKFLYHVEVFNANNSGLKLGRKLKCLPSLASVRDEVLMREIEFHGKLLENFYKDHFYVEKDQQFRITICNK